MTYKSFTRMIALVALLAFTFGTVAAEDISQDQKKIYEAKDLMYASNYSDAYKIFMEVYNNKAYTKRDEALYYAALCSFKLSKFEKAREELDRFHESFNSSNWSDDVNQLMNDVNRALGKTTGDPEAILVVNEAEIAAITEQTEEIARHSHEIAAVAEHTARSLVSIDEDGKYLNQDCKDPDGKKEAALNALIHMDDEARVISIIEKFMATNPCGRLKSKAFFVLAQQDSEKALDILVKAAKTDEDLAVRKNALFWVGQYDDERSCEILVTMYDDVKDAATKKNIVFSLSQQEQPKAVDKLIEIAKTEPNVEVRKSAIHWIGQVDEPSKVIPAMKEIYGNAGESVEIRKGVLFSLSQIEEPAASDMLLELAKTEPNFELRKNAIFWLSQVDDEEKVVETLVQLYSTEKNREVKSSILFSLGNVDRPELTIKHLERFFNESKETDLKKKISFTIARISDDSDEAVELMIKLIEQEKDPEVRKALLFYLNQSDNPKAQDYLISSIEGDLIG